MRILATLALAAALLSPGAAATTAGTDVTDYWYAPGESGWAVNVSHQFETVFLTFYVYDASGRPVWYSGSAPQGTATAQYVPFSGDLYETHGPWFGGAFNAAAVQYR